VVHVGDLTLDGAHQPDQLPRARARLERLPVAWRSVPGNHDIGHNGVVSLELDLDLDHQAPPRPVLVAPDGLAQLTMGRDIPNPYHH
jgi:hypothetical protein